MRESEIGSLICPVARTIGLIGDPWTLLILRELFLGTRRFEDFQAYTGASPRVLAARLAKLVEHGLIKKEQYSERPARFEYRLTRKGMELHGIVVSLNAWGAKWTKVDGEKAPPLTLVHRTCGHTLHSALTCTCCNEKIEPTDVLVRIGKAMGKQRSEMKSDFYNSVDRKV